MFVLHEQGCTAAEIARRCAEGTASAAPFQVPRRTAHQIVTKMAREQGHKPPKSIENASQSEALERYPRECECIAMREQKRIRRKQSNGKPLSKNDLEALVTGAKLLTAVRRVHNGSGARSKSPTANGTAPNGNDHKERPEPLAGAPPGARAGHRSARFHKRAKKDFSHAYTPRSSLDAARAPAPPRQTGLRAGRRPVDRGADRGLDPRGVHGGDSGSDRESLLSAFNLTSTVFPEGTSVGAYPQSNWPAPGQPSGAPVGSATETATVTNGMAALRLARRRDPLLGCRPGQRLLSLRRVHRRRGHPLERQGDDRPRSDPGSRQRRAGSLSGRGQDIRGLGSGSATIPDASTSTKGKAKLSVAPPPARTRSQSATTTHGSRAPDRPQPWLAPAARPDPATSTSPMATLGTQTPGPRPPTKQATRQAAQTCSAHPKSAPRPRATLTRMRCSRCCKRDSRGR